ncbi:predicted protein [Plenodomus lingam JN3]|uniref:Uncharacterized protein n=1 Tax=Leptosphaeria maculans (strain JN3 / isolate v23.1.3 / race Av1-4-5-6-7-8) TaxID=985895 RepID=E5A668_LEPMJ|nr:predicted protein [Plenodomus lingam JN3]CBX99113.1 predicted protein [Plenodomus lingam JN3]
MIKDSQDFAKVEALKLFDDGVLRIPKWQSPLRFSFELH